MEEIGREGNLSLALTKEKCINFVLSETKIRSIKS